MRLKTGNRVRVDGSQGPKDFGVRKAILMMTTQQVAGADPLIESPIAAVFGFAAGLWLLGTLFHPWAAHPPPRWACSAITYYLSLGSVKDGQQFSAFAQY
jgi:hypothetical protein